MLLKIQSLPVYQQSTLNILVKGIIVSGSILIFVALVFSGIVNFLSISIYSRLLTPEEYGHYSVITAGLAFAYAFVFFWLITSFTRFAAAGKKSISETQIASFYNIYLILCLISAAIIYLCSLFLINMKVPAELWFFIFCSLVFEAAFHLFSAHARFITNSPRTFSFAVIIRSILAVVLGWYSIDLGYGYVGIIGAVALSFFISLVFLFLFNKIYKQVSIKSLDSQFLTDICSYGLPIVLILAIQSAINATDRVLLVNLISAEAAGQYSASQDLVVKLLIFLVGILHRVLFPLVIKKMDTESLINVKKQLQKNITFILMVSLPAALAICFYAKNIVFVVLGEEFRLVSAELMPYQVFIAMLNCLTMFYIVAPFYLFKKTKALIFPSLIALIANISIGYFAIQEIGMYGAVLASFVAYSLYFSITLYLGRKILKLPLPIIDIAKIIACSGFMIIALMPLQNDYGVLPLVILVICGIFSYSFAILILNVANFRSILFNKILRKKSVSSN